MTNHFCEKENAIMAYGKRILIVDDEEQIGHLLAEYLERHHFATVAVADGLQALRELHHRHFDAVITDLHMPYLDGLDLLCQCHLVWPQLPVILMSGNLLDIVWPAMARGAYACLPKPVDTEKLVSVLSEAISDTDDPRSDQRDMITHMLEAQRRWSVPERATDSWQAGGITNDEAH
jgi:DNA-binding NtrC family response regulator